jgi:hypothetical protein
METIVARLERLIDAFVHCVEIRKSQLASAGSLARFRAKQRPQFILTIV